MVQWRLARLEQRDRLPRELLSLAGSGVGDETGRAARALLGLRVPEYKPTCAHTDLQSIE